jgi:PAS domain S-box-containing protein
MLMRIVKQPTARYVLAVLAAVAALVLRKLLNPLLGSENPYHTAWVAVAFSAWFCGIGPAIVTVVISVVGIWYWFLPPDGSFALRDTAQIFGMLGFMALCAAIIAMGEFIRRSITTRLEAEENLRKTHRELEDRVKERTAALQQRTAELADQAMMLDLANDAIFVRTARDTISYWNEGAERLYGWTKAEALGRTIHQLLRTEFPIPLASIQSRETWEGELRHTKQDGTHIIVASRWRTLRDRDRNVIGWLEINTDVTSRKRAEEATRRLSGRILTLQDEERRRIARGLHDSLGQYLAALKMNLDCLPNPTNEQSKLISDCSDIVSRSLAEIRTISHLLHPPLLDESGLDSAARWYVDEFSRRSGIAVTLNVSPERMRLPSDVEIALFRAIQEGLTNVHRHSGATSVDIRVSANGTQVRLEIRDNGRGIPQEQLSRFAEGPTPTGVGLAGMRERVHELRGTLEIHSNGTGTALTIVVPASSKPTIAPGSLVA